MSLAEGFQSGFNLALSARKLALEKEKQEKQMELVDVQIKGEEAEIDYKKQRLDLEQRQAEAVIQSNEANTAYRNALASDRLSMTQRRELENEESDKARQYKTAIGILESLRNLPDDPAARDLFISQTYAAVEKLQKEGFDFVNIFSPETAAAFGNMQTMFNSGDFSQISNHVEDINQIFAPEFRQFKGNKFITQDGREGTIVGVKFDGTIQGKNMGRDANLGAMFEVQFTEPDKMVDVPNQVATRVEGQKTVESFFSYVPEIKGKVTQDTEGTDAKNVSIAEATDKMSALRSLMGLGMSNPALVEASKKYAELSLIDLEGKVNLTKEETDKVTARGIHDAAVEKHSEMLASIEENFGGGYDDPDVIDQIIRQARLLYPELEAEMNEDGLFELPEEFEGELGKYLNSVQPEYSDAVKKVKRGLNPTKEGQLEFYNFGKTSFRFDASRDEYLPFLRRVYGEDVLNKAMARASDVGATEDDELLDFLYLNLYKGS